MCDASTHIVLRSRTYCVDAPHMLCDGNNQRKLGLSVLLKLGFLYYNLPIACHKLSFGSGDSIQIFSFETG